MVKICFFVFMALLWCSVFVVGASYKFKEVYKKYHNTLFRKNVIARPCDWGISRQRNHNIHLTFKWLSILFLFLAVMFNTAIHSIIALCVLIVILPLLMFVLGMAFGKMWCHKRVKSQCKKFRISYKKV